MVVFYQNGEPQAIIEVKKVWDRKDNSVISDTKRIRTMLKAKKAKAGYIVLYSEAKKKNTIGNRFKAIKKNINGYRHKTIGPFAVRGDDWKWGLNVIELRS